MFPVEHSLAVLDVAPADTIEPSDRGPIAQLRFDRRRRAERGRDRRCRRGQGIAAASGEQNRQGEQKNESKHTPALCSDA